MPCPPPGKSNIRPSNASRSENPVTQHRALPPGLHVRAINCTEVQLMIKRQGELPNANDNQSPLGFVQELTEVEPARELRTPVDPLQRERPAGRIGYARVGRRVFYPIVCIEKYRQDRITRCQATSSVVSGRSRIGTHSTPSSAARRAGQLARRISR